MVFIKVEFQSLVQKKYEGEGVYNYFRDNRSGANPILKYNKAGLRFLTNTNFSYLLRKVKKRAVNKRNFYTVDFNYNLDRNFELCHPIPYK